jgi:ferritin-like metal-binding protein YciE
LGQKEDGQALAGHYEMATYGGMKQLAMVLGYPQAATLLEQSLAEEKKADELLSETAENNVNPRALEEMK